MRRPFEQTGLKRRARAFAAAPLLALALLGAPSQAGAGAGTAITNPDPIAIPTLGAATPYPSIIEVSRLPGRVTAVQVVLLGIVHGEADQIDVLLAGPAGQATVVMSDACGGEYLFGKILFFAEVSPGPLVPGECVTGHGYKPTDTEPGDPFPAPAPAGPHPASLSVFDGTRPNGAWRLFVLDDEAGADGTIEQGWLLQIGVKPDRCGGRAATIGGTARGEVLAGTPRSDVIVGLGGGDDIRGLGGDDVICGRVGRDRLIGGAGADELIGGPGMDVCAGGPGRDVVRGCEFGEGRLRTGALGHRRGLGPAGRATPG
jgi:hypothetical protein